MTVIRLLILFLLLFNPCFGQVSDYSERIDSLFLNKTKKPFNGIILIDQNGQTKYLRTVGYSNIDVKTPLEIDDQFVIGSISKQFTAALILREYEKGNLKLHVPISTYLPDLNQSWADTVTIHHLLTHTHGIIELNKPTAFKSGAKFSYSNIGYELLSKIVEKTSGQSFDHTSMELFKTCGLKGTFHPAVKNYQNLVKGYTEHQRGIIELETKSVAGYVAAGGFISTVADMILWNKCFYEGKSISDKAKKLMVTKQKGAIRNHPIFGKTEYGYGITIDTKENILQYGQTGLVPGFVSMNFYFPKSKTSVIVFENISYGINDLNETFKYHTEVLKILRNSELVQKTTAYK